LPVVLAALARSWIATATAWLYLPNRATYVDIPAYHFTMTLFVWALLVGPAVSLISAGYIRLVGWVSHHRASGPKILITLPVALTALGFIGIEYPQLFGNGKDMAHSFFLGEGGLGLLLALFALKPLVTSLCLGSGAAGGLFTPTLSTGAVLGGFLTWPARTSGPDHRLAPMPWLGPRR
jgi:CIC family chloride channel protein